MSEKPEYLCTEVVNCCPLHKSAPKLLEALENASKLFRQIELVADPTNTPRLLEISLKMAGPGYLLTNAAIAAAKEKA